MKKNPTDERPARSSRRAGRAPVRSACGPAALGVPEGLEAPDAAGRLLGALAADLEAVYGLVPLLGDDEIDADEVVEWLSVMATSTARILPGSERAWLLRQLLRVTGACSDEGTDDDLPRLLPRSPEPTKNRDTSPGKVRLLDALRDLDPPTRAAVVLVVHEGLSFQEAAGVLGGTRGALAERYAQGVALLGDELIDVMLGRVI